MDYIQAGTTIKLGPRDSIVLGYLSSCVVETVSGGTVVVGREQGEVQGGSVRRISTRCDRGNIDLTPKQANQSAGQTFRAPDEAIHLIYGLSPFFEAEGNAALLIVRLDRPSEHFTAVLQPKRGSQASYFDAFGHFALKAGVGYGASIGARRMLFKVDADAKPGRLPIISRLVRFGPD